ncbi:RelA/SpoT family protein [Sulfurimonas sp. HSL-1716]|uniref:RelA/SpoT family protein n=1 Tax=Hydrocurvibacter sulfurireducens TaxID=3131937 RepID=UPI0031F814EB
MSRFNLEKIKHLHSVDSAKDYLFKHIEHSEKLREALDFASKAHHEQFRKSGEPYIIHPILVASIVASITNDESMTIAALLHDIVEDTDVAVEEITERFGYDVAHLVEGLTKIDIIRDAELIPSSSDEKLIVSALSFRKMLVASIHDVRVLVVKLCDRLHNMLTLDALAPYKQHRIAEETLVVYGPIAHRLGISFLKNMLEDLSFAYLFKEEKHYIDNYLDTNYRELETKLDEFKQSVSKLLVQNGYCEDDFEILSRVKHKYSIYLKMQRKGITIDEVLDLLAIRVLVKNEIDCYKILGIIHLHFRPLASRFKDYIAIAKENGYQTIHTSVFFNYVIFEVQIRTFAMHKTAEYGVAAHWKYKNGGNEINLDWLKNLQYQNESVEDFYEMIKNDLYSEDISVFSPKGDAYTLPRGAVALDFAYAVHSKVGDCAASCLVNKERVSLLSELQNGDIVNIITEKEPVSRCSWLDAVKTSRAKTYMKALCNSKFKHIDSLASVSIVATIMGLNNSRVEEWFSAHNCGEARLKIPNDLNQLKETIAKYVEELSKNKRFSNFLTRRRFKFKEHVYQGVKVISNKSINGLIFDYCCHPKMSDPIVGILHGSKVHIHHKMCQNALNQIKEFNAMVFVKWEDKKVYHYHIIVSLQNGKGALANFLTYLAKIDIDIMSIVLGKEKVDHVHYCEIDFHSTEANIYQLQGKIEKKVKVINLVRTDDVYKKD